MTSQSSSDAQGMYAYDVDKDSRSTSVLFLVFYLGILSYCLP